MKNELTKEQQEFAERMTLWGENDAWPIKKEQWLNYHLAKLSPEQLDVIDGIAEWCMNKPDCAYRDENGIILFIHAPYPVHPPIIDKATWKKLKPHLKPKQKGFELSDPQPGDKFLAGLLPVIEFQFKSECGKFYTFKTHHNTYYVCKKDGVIDSFNRITKQIEDRPWLKEFPPAKYFDLKDDEVLAYSGCGNYWTVAYKNAEQLPDDLDWEGPSVVLHHITMPKLINDQWKRSKISKAELQKWQGTNNA